MKNIKISAVLTLIALCVALMLSACSDDNKKNNEQTALNQQENKAENEKAKEQELVNYPGFSNISFLNAVAECLGKDATSVTKEDVLDIRYLAVGPEDDGTITVYVGMKDYVDKAYSADVTIEELKKYVKTARIEDATDVSCDFGIFENLEIFEFYNVEVQDVSFVNNYSQLVFGYFDSNGITDVSSLENYNPQTLIELDFTGNDIVDWSPLYHIKEKVIVNFSVQHMTDESGNRVELPIVVTLADMLNSELGTSSDTQQSETQNGGENIQENENEDEKIQEQESQIMYDIDWGTLFE
ncbi:MAG: hypothetical protein J6K12_02500 [Clostridia bacterium]|nr:hypothetical protein [Clostridia bacterium]